MSKQDLISFLAPHGQEHLVDYWDELSESEKDELLAEIKHTNFAELNEFFRVSTQSNKKSQPSQMQPVPDDLKGSYAKSPPEQLSFYEQEGLKSIANNEVAVILLAGGQGTRLGVSYPKGMYSVGLPSNKSLLQIQAERLLRVKSMASEINPDGVRIPWYIMVSETTLESTAEFFETHNYFGLNRQDVLFFEQGTLPCFFKDGRIILESKSKISRAPDGNGGLYQALRTKGMLDDMAERGIKYVHAYCVDNILVKVADPVFTGFCITKNLNCGSKVVKKVHPEESVGVICKANGYYQVVEYSEISETCRNLRDQSGDLVFNAGNICNHFFTTEFLDNLCRRHENELKHHVASKKIPYLNQEGVLVKPTVENGIKLEKFIFDVFEFSNASWAKGNFGIWEVLREDEFSPLKNSDAAKSDNPRTCREMLFKMHAKWLRNAGGKLLTKNSSPQVEISPLVSYNGENLEPYVDGKTFEEPVLIELDPVTQRPLFNGLDLEQVGNWRSFNGCFIGNIIYS